MRTSGIAIYHWTNLLLTVLLPAVGLLLGHVSVFYIIYLYWWHELISSAMDAIYFPAYKRQNPDAAFGNPFGSRLFLLFIYFVFIVVLFGAMSDWGNDVLLKLNIQVFLFRDIGFNLSLLGLLVNEWWLRQYRSAQYVLQQNPFSGRMWVLHLSIIFGGITFLALSRGFFHGFSAENQWTPIFAAVPFLLLKAVAAHRQRISGMEDGGKS